MRATILRRNAALLAIVCCAGIILVSMESSHPTVLVSSTEASTKGDAASRIRTLIAQRRFEEAEAAALRLLAEAEEEHGPESLQVAHAIDLLMSINYASAAAVEPEGLLALAERAVRIKEADLGPRDEDLVISLTQLGHMLQFRGHFEEALPLLLRALEISQEHYAAHDFRLARVFNQLGSLSVELNDWATARASFEKALEIFEAVPAAERERLRGLRFNYGRFLEMEGDYEAARAIYESTTRRENAPADQRGGGLLVLGGLLRKMGELDEARPLLERALGLLRESHGPQSQHVAAGLGSLADLYQDRGEIERAGPLYEEALAIVTKVFGPDHPSVALCRRNLAQNLLLRGALERARTLLEQARDTQERYYGSSNIPLAQTHLVLAKVHWAARRYTAALQSALRAEQVSRSHYREMSYSLSQRGGLCYELIAAAGIDMAFSSLLAAGPIGSSTAATASVWDELIQSRAVVLDEVARHQQAASALRTAEAERLRKELAAARNRLARLVMTESPEGDPQDFRQSLGRARAEKERLERAVAGAGSAGRKTGRSRIVLSNVVRLLPPGSGLVAYARFDALAAQLREPPEPSYVALITARGRNAPLLVSLGPADRIERLIDRWKDSVGSDPRASPRGTGMSELLETGRELRAAIWDPVAPFLSNAEQVFIVADAALNLVNFGTLPLADGRYLIESGPTLHYLSAERDLSKGSTTPSRTHGLLALGGADFDAGEGSTAGSTVSKNTAPHKADSVVIRRRNARATCLSLKSLRFEELPASLDEVTDIAAIWRGAPGRRPGDERPVLILTGAGADEASFKRLAPGHKILHLATHGFLAQDGCESKQQISHVATRGHVDPLHTLPANLGDDPLLLSGLALAGANRRDKIGSDSDSEDGILTGEEIASIDLSSVQWVVLSACESGVGRALSGEGVLGLRRAFEVAGARTLIMSLWQVEDEATHVWMRHLYEGRLSGLSTSAAVRQASLQMIDEMRRRGESPHPYFWGAFVAAGDWR